MRSSERQRIREAIQASRPVAFSGRVWRAHLDVPGVTALTPTIEASGRWNLGSRRFPDRAFPVLYTALREAASVAEVTRHIDRIPPELRPTYALSLITFELSRVIDVRDPAQAIGLDQQALEDDWDYEAPQTIGEAAHEFEFEGILARSVTKLSDVLVVLTDRLLPTSRLQVESTEPLKLGPDPQTRH